MENFKSKPFSEGRIQAHSYSYGGPPTPSSTQDIRSHSTCCAQSPKLGKELKIKKGRVSGGSPNSIKGWGLFSDPELQRKRRVAGYRVYIVEGKMKGSLRKSFRWIKDTCTHLVYGWW